MDIDQAADALDKKLRRHPWYISTGVGEANLRAALFVYVKSARHQEIRDLSQWMGYPVIVRATGPFRPV